jgi:hypothetical protein
MEKNHSIVSKYLSQIRILKIPGLTLNVPALSCCLFIGFSYAGCRARSASTEKSNMVEMDLKDKAAEAQVESILDNAETLAKAMEDKGEDDMFDPKAYMKVNRDRIDRLHSLFESTKMELRKRLIDERSLANETASFFERVMGHEDPFFVEVESTQKILFIYRDGLHKLIGNTSYYDQELFKLGQLYDKKINTSWDKLYDSITKISDLSFEDAIEYSFKAFLKSLPNTVKQNCDAIKRYKTTRSHRDFAVNESLIGQITDSPMLREAILGAAGLNDDFSMFEPKMPTGMCEQLQVEAESTGLTEDVALNLNLDELEYLIFSHLPFIKFVGAQFALRGFVPAGASQLDLAAGIRYGTPLDGSHFPCLETFASARMGFGDGALRGLTNSVSKSKYILSPRLFSKFLKRKLVLALGFKSLELPPPLLGAQKNGKGEYPNWYEYPIVSFSLMASSGSAKVTKTFTNAIRSWWKGTGWNKVATVATDSTWDFEINIHPTTQTLYLKALGGGSQKTVVPGVSSELLETTAPGFGVTAGAEVLLTSTCHKRRHALAMKAAGH